MNMSKTMIIKQISKERILILVDIVNLILLSLLRKEHFFFFNLNIFNFNKHKPLKKIL